MVKRLLRDDYEATIFDDFSTGHREAVLGGEIIEGSLTDVNTLEKVFASHEFRAVMHFASFIHVSESISFPAKYYRNNVVNTLNLLDAMLQRKVSRTFLFTLTS